MSPSPANNDGQHAHSVNDAEVQHDNFEQASLETAQSLGDETPLVGEPDSVSASLADLSPDEVAQAKEAIAFLDEVRDENRQTIQMPSAIGKYSIVRSLGRGGFAEVFLAEDEELDRHVALKVPLFNSTTNEDGRQRFEREARLAASLGHPQIVPVYEYGDLGPIRFIAFEWCDGPTLGQWVAENGPVKPEMAARIIEFLARAVQHAHQRGIVHRDLKPANVLVDSSEQTKGKPVWERLRITDFGLARNFDGQDMTLTQDGQFVGTPAYMAPEQAGSGAEVGPCSDVWALGMILFELLTGELPFRKPDIMATIRAICDDRIPKVKSISSNIPSALDAIADLSLRKNPAERYESAHELAEDLQRFTRGEPVKAKPQTALSKFAMWIRRNPSIAAASSLAFLFLSLGLAGTTWQYLQATKNLAIAEKALEEEQKARTKAQRIAGLFTKTYRRSDPDMDGRQLKVVDMLELTAEEVSTEFEGDQESKWELQFELAKTYHGLGVFDSAIELLQEIRVEMIESEFRESEMMLRTLVALQRSMHSSAKYDQSRELAEEATELSDKLDAKGTLLASVLMGQGSVLEHDNQHGEALVIFRHAIAEYESDENCELIDTLTARTSCAMCQRMLGLHEEAVSWLEPLVAESIEQYGNKRPVINELLQEYASVLVQLKRYDKAIEVFKEQLAISNELLGPEHGRTQQIKNNLASTLTFVGRRDEAIAIYREVISAAEKSLGVNHPQTAVTRFLLGSQLVKVGKFEEAEPELQKSYDILKGAVGINNPWTNKSHQSLVWLWFRAENWEKTFDHFVEHAEANEALATEKSAIGAALSRIEAGQTMIRMGKLKAGMDLVDKNLDLLLRQDKVALHIHYHSPVLSALIDQSAFEEAVPYAEKYLSETPIDYEHAFDVCTSRILAAAIALQIEAPFSVAVLADVDLNDAAKLNTEQWLLLSTSMEILERGLEDDAPECVSQRELISSLLNRFQELTADSK